MCQVFTKAFMQSGISTKMACIEKKMNLIWRLMLRTQSFLFFFFSHKCWCAKPWLKHHHFYMFLLWLSVISAPNFFFFFLASNSCGPCVCIEIQLKLNVNLSVQPLPFPYIFRIELYALASHRLCPIFLC